MHTNTFVRGVGINSCFSSVFFLFSLPGGERNPIKRKPHDARTPHIAEKSIWHASMSDTEGTASNSTPANGVADAGASPAGSGSVAQGSAAGAASPGSATNHLPATTGPTPQLGVERRETVRAANGAHVGVSVVPMPTGQRAHVLGVAGLSGVRSIGQRQEHLLRDKGGQPRHLIHLRTHA